MSDVGLNTSGGEGYGMCCVEHQLVGKPQVITALDNNKELFNSEWSKLLPVKARISVTEKMDGVGGVLEIPSYLDVSDALDFYYKNPQTRQLHGEQGQTYFQAKKIDMHQWLEIISL